MLSTNKAIAACSAFKQTLRVLVCVFTRTILPIKHLLGLKSFILGPFIQPRFLREASALCALLLLSTTLSAQVYNKNTNINFRYSTSAATNTLIVHAFPGSFCVTSPAPTTNIRKATLNALLDWRGDYKASSPTTAYTVTLTIQAFSTYTGTTSGLIATYTPTLSILTNSPQSYISIDFTGIYPAVNRFLVQATYSLTAGSSLSDIESVMNTTVYYTEDFDYNAYTAGSTMITLSPVTYSNNVANFSWATNCQAAPDYQFQLLRLYNTYTTSISSESVITTDIDWNKALTIETNNSLNQLSLTLAEGTGYYAWRVRPIGNAYDGGIANDRNWGTWSDVGGLTQGATSFSVTTDVSPYLFFYTQFDDNRSWIFTRNFVEGDATTTGQVNIGEAINYANGLQMAQQQQVRLISRQKTLVNQTLYDYCGRAALNTLPAPIDRNSLGYIPSYIKNTSGQSYSAPDFDATSTFTAPAIMDSSIVANGLNSPSQYYSALNPNETDIPTAAGYPYTRTLFSKDGLNKPLEKSSPGYVHRINTSNKHTARTLYSGVADIELIRVFGDEAPYENSVYKTINFDANSQASIAYTSKEGKTIATCLSTPTLTNLDPIASATLSAFTTTTNINNNNSSSGPYAFRSFKSVAFSEPTTVTLNYSLTPNTYTDACNNFCATCDYKLTLKVTDNNDPDATPIYQYTTAIGSASNTAGCTGTTVTQAPSFSVVPGAYTVERIIEANNTSTVSAVGNTYINDYVQQIRSGLYSTWSAGTATLVSDAGVPLLNGGLTYTVSMGTINAFLRNSSLDSLYTYLGVVSTDTHKNIQVGCYTVKMPVWFCNTRTCTDNDMGFERYFYNWYKAKNPTSSLTNQQMLDLILNTGSARTYSYSVNEFDTVVNNMIHCGGYDCQKLWDCWQSTVASFGASSLSTSSYTSPVTTSTYTFANDYLDRFLGCAGYNIQGITSTSWTGQGCSTFGYKSHPYAWFNYPTACATCEQLYCEGTTTVLTTNCPGCSGTPWAAFTATFNANASAAYTQTTTNNAGTVTSFTSTPKNDFFNCYRHTTNCTQGTTPPTNSYTNTINYIVQNCETYCNGRFDEFVSSVIDAYHGLNEQVEGDPYVLVADPEFGGYSFGTTTFTGTPYVSMATVYCEANELLNDCKSRCAITVQTNSALGSGSQKHDIANIFSGRFKVAIGGVNGNCPAGYGTDAHYNTGNKIRFYVTVLNNQLKKVRDTTGSSGVYWDYYAFLTDIDGGTSSLCSHNKVFVHPDIPSYFDSLPDPVNRGCSILVYYFNSNKTSNSIISPKPVYSTTSISAGSTYTYTSTGTLTAQSATTLTPTSYIFDSSFSPSITYSVAPGNFEFLQDAANGINPIAITNTTTVYSYSNTAYPTYGYWTETLCSNICSANGTCTPICYTLVPMGVSTDPVVTYTALTCAAQTSKDIQNSLGNQVDLLIDSTAANLQRAYTTQCIQNLVDNYTMQYSLHYHHYTLYYYDRAGNLTKTVPPKGVESNTVTLSDRTVHPAYTYITEYAYNSLGQLTRQKTPDGGETNFQYDVKGRLRFSQNAKQLAATKNSYTKYDALARIIEVGELSGTPSSSNLNDMTYPTAGTGADITQTFYSNPTTVSYFGNKPQRYLQNRVSYSLTDRDGNTATTGDQVKTAYSYDPHGNVEWLTQDIPELGRSYVGYEYDLVSGSVTKVKYNEQFADRFYHRYTYDVDKRLQTLETSKDNYFWEKDANYNYYLHGPLKSALIGHDQIQGLDYTYTIHGWLKSMNNINQLSDPGGDGSLIGDDIYIAKDAYGMVLGYYAGDYVNKTSFLNAASSNTLYLGGTSLYNGNISSWTQNYDNAITSALTGFVYNSNAMGRTFKYDQLNRITAAQTNTFASMVWGTVSDFKEAFTYDPNGNITKLLRNGNSVTGLSMDSLTYRYSSAATDNMLLSVHDLTTTTTTYSVDIDNQAASNYTYDAIGNLTADASGSITAITWNVYGKMASLTKSDGTVVTYLYDASGNRVYRQLAPSATPTVITTTYYVKDASGNSMAVYDRTNTGTNPNYTANYTLREEPIYGSDRIGTRTEAIARSIAYTGTNTPVPQTNPTTYHTSAYGQLLLPMLNSTSNQLFIENINTASTTSTSILTSAAEHTLNMSSLTTNTAVTFIGARANAQAFDAAGNTVISAWSYSASSTGTVPSGMLMYLRDNDPVTLPAAMTASIDPNSQAAFIKKPGSDEYYYFFTIGKDGKPYYHTIDASLGDVIDYNNLLDNNTTYGQTMALLEDQVGQGPSMLYLKRFDATNTYIQPFSITQAGITALPQLTVTTSDPTYAATGDIQLAPSDTLLAIGTHQSGQGLISMYRVSADHQTLTSCGKIVFGSGNYCKSIEFGPTNQYMFFTLNTGASTTNLNRVAISSFTSSAVTLSVSVSAEQMDTRTTTNIVSAISRGANNYLYYVTNTGGSSIDLRLFANPEAAIATASVNTTTNITNISVANFPVRSHLLAYAVPSPTTVASARNLDKKEYELKDHLGNVHITVKDYKVPFSGTTDTKYDERFNDGSTGSVAGSYTITAGSPTVTTVSNFNNMLMVFGTQGSTVNNVISGLTMGHKYLVAFDYQHNNCAAANYSLTTGYISSGNLQQDGRTQIITDVGSNTSINLLFSCQDPTASRSFYIDNILLKDLGTSITVQTNTVLNEPFTSGGTWPWVATNTAISYTANTMHVSGTTGSSLYAVSRAMDLIPGQIYKIRMDLTASSVGTSTLAFNFNGSNNVVPDMEFSQLMLGGTITYTFYVTPKTVQNTVYLTLTTPSSSFSFDIDNFIVEIGQQSVKPLYTAVANDITDYYAFGMPMPGRTYHVSVPNSYRYGFNGQMNDDEIYGAGNLTAAEYWEYDTRLGRRWNKDPIIKPWEAPYACFADNPILYKDVKGLEAEGGGDPKIAPAVSTAVSIGNKEGLFGYELPEVKVTPQNTTPSSKIGNFFNKFFGGIKTGLERLDNRMDMPDFTPPVRTGLSGYQPQGGKVHKGNSISGTGEIETTDAGYPGGLLISLGKPELVEAATSLAEGLDNASKVAEAYDHTTDELENMGIKDKPELEAETAKTIRDTIYMKWKTQGGTSYRFIVKDEKGDSVGGAYYTGPDRRKQKTK